MGTLSIDGVRREFDALAAVVDAHGSGVDHHDAYLCGLVPEEARDVVEIGCGLGRLTAKLACAGRSVLGVDLSPEMIARARAKAGEVEGVSFLCADFLSGSLDGRTFDAVVSAATLHHVPADEGFRGLARLVRPGGLLVAQDLRATNGLFDEARACSTLIPRALRRVARTGRLREPPAVREAWKRHGDTDTYLSFDAARALAREHLPGAAWSKHWDWRYTVVWRRPS